MSTETAAGLLHLLLHLCRGVVIGTLTIFEDVYPSRFTAVMLINPLVFELLSGLANSEASEALDLRISRLIPAYDFPLAVASVDLPSGVKVRELCFQIRRPNEGVKTVDFILRLTQRVKRIHFEMGDDSRPEELVNYLIEVES